MKVDAWVMLSKRMMRKYFSDEKMKMLLKSYAEIAKEERQRGIEEQVSPDGNRFHRLRPKTIKRKQKKGSAQPSKALIDKGYMKNPVTKATATEGKVIPPKSREDIIRYHEMGNENLPARPNWAIYPEAHRRIERLWKKHLAKFVKELARG